MTNSQCESILRRDPGDKFVTKTLLELQLCRTSQLAGLRQHRQVGQIRWIFDKEQRKEDVVFSSENPDNVSHRLGIGSGSAAA
jgi:hypothetical protein